MFYQAAAVYLPLFWLALTIIFLIGEAVTVDLVSIWFAMGAVVAILPAALHAPFWFQAVTFFAVAILSLVLTRPIVKKMLSTRKVATNADGNIGKMATVILDIDNARDQGRVHLDGLDWAARSEDDSFIETGERVLVKNIVGVKLIVEKLS